MKFQVPQFVEVEDKIFWKLTFKQFVYLAGGAGLCLMIYLFVKPLFLAALVMAPVAAFGLALAFYKYNDRPFIFMIESASKYVFNTKLYIWKKEESPAPQKASAADTDDGFVPKLSDSRLKELTWSLDAKQTANPVTHNDKTM